MDFTRPDGGESDSMEDNSGGANAFFGDDGDPDGEMGMEASLGGDGQLEGGGEDEEEDVQAGEEEEYEGEEDEEEDDDEEALLVAEINRLQDELSYDPSNYENHVALISKLKSVGDLELLREAREKMNKLYPLSPQLWMEWINDETQLASTTEQKKAVIALYDRAVAEYLDSNLWSNYVQYSVELSEENILSSEEVHKLFDRALNHIGCNVAAGSLFWRYYRLLESAAEDLDEEQIKQHLKVNFDLFQRQFSVPLLEMDVDYQQFEQWLEQIKQSYSIDLDQFKKEIASVKAEYEKTLKVLQSLSEFETALKTSSHPHLNEYLKYLDAEIKNGNLARTQCLFERAITDNCLNGELWLKYLKFCDGKFVVGDLLLPLYERAIRNCPWVADIWVQYMVAREALGQGDATDLNVLDGELWAILERAMKNTFSSPDDYKKLWLAYINFIRRKTSALNSWSDEEQVKSVRDTFESVLNHLESISSVEFCYDVYHYFAKIEAKYCKNMANARKIYSDLLSRSSEFRKMASFWLDFANLELMYGEEDEYRKILYKGLNLCSDYPESIGDALLRFEREDGRSVEQYRTSMAKYEAALKKINDRRAKEAAASESGAVAKAAEKSQPSKAVKRKADAGGEANKNNKSNKDHVEAKKKRVNEPPAKHGVSGMKTDDAKREQTVFLSNLVFDLEEDDIRNAFLQFGPINEIRLVRDYKGRSKGYCYVEFENIGSARKSLLHDRMLLRGRPVFINEIDKRTTFSYSTNLEKNKLFVKNIPFELTKEDLMTKVFADYADSVVDIRLATFRNGHSKGIAYVEMKSAAIAEKAVEDKNNFEIGDRKLFVAISDPSAAKQQHQQRPAAPGALAKKFGPSKTSSSSLMIPHALMAKSHPTRVKLQLDNFKQPASPATASATDTGDQSAPAASAEDSNNVGAKNNDFFRSMF